MHVLLIYAHPSADSFTREVKDAFCAGLTCAGHTYEISDLYAMNFCADMSEQEYLRDAYYRSAPPVAPDVRCEQEKILRSDAITFVYPVFWTEAPAKLVGWFDRVWSYGFAYGTPHEMHTLTAALFLCVAGNTAEFLRETGRLAAMKNVMIDDRINDRAKRCDMIVLGGTSRENMPQREANRPQHLRTAYEAGRYFASLSPSPSPRLSIRTAAKEDSASILDLHIKPMVAVSGAYKGDGPWDDDLKDVEGVYLSQNGAFVLGELDGKPVAMGAFKPAEGGYAEIKRMRVYPEHQGKGFGHQIYTHLELTAKERGYKGFILETSIHQTGAQAFYRTNGFSEERREVIDGLLCIWYRKTFS